MGKEKSDVRAYKMRSIPENLLYFGKSANDRWVSVWSESQFNASTDQICDDGYAIVSIHSRDLYRRLRCSMLKHEGNDYTQLGEALKNRGIIKTGQITKAFFLHKDCMWCRVDPTQESFRSGDNVAIMIEEVPVPKTENKKIKPGVKKLIKKLPRSSP